MFFICTFNASKLLLVTFYLNGGFLHAVSIRKPSEQMSNFQKKLNLNRISVFCTSLRVTDCFFWFEVWNYKHYWLTFGRVIRCFDSALFSFKYTCCWFLYDRLELLVMVSLQKHMWIRLHCFSKNIPFPFIKQFRWKFGFGGHGSPSQWSWSCTTRVSYQYSCMVRTAGRYLRRMHARSMHSTSGVCVCCLASNGTNLYGMMMYGG